MGFDDARWVALPIERAGELVGVMALFFAVRRPFDDDELRLYRGLAAILGNAIANARLFEARSPPARPKPSAPPGSKPCLPSPGPPPARSTRPRSPATWSTSSAVSSTSRWPPSWWPSRSAASSCSRRPTARPARPPPPPCRSRSTQTSKRPACTATARPSPSKTPTMQGWWALRPAARASRCRAPPGRRART